MGKTKIAITLDEQYIDQLDTFVSKHIFRIVARLFKRL